MDEDVDFDNAQPDLQCNVCGETEFNLQDGFYYCCECGTRMEQIQDIQVDDDDRFRDAKHVKETTLKKEKTETPNVTSWECYNYILRGLVEELMLLGAKEEFKLITLQLWAAYLRRKEVAFFNKKHAELPKLGALFHKRDANILYNHTLEKRKKNKKANTINSSRDSTRDWRNQKRKLATSLYSETSAEYSSSCLGSSSTGTTGHAIQIKFSSHARKILKKQMPVNHIEKHEKDACGILDCHTFPTKKGSLKAKDYYIARTTIKEVYTILAIALNLAEDEIQITDLVRFIAEGHIGTKNVLKYFPENVAAYGKEILNDISFYWYSGTAAYRFLTENIQFMAKFIGIQEYRTPNLISLAARYISDLNLPSELATYVESLINLLPPQMKMRSSKLYPDFEARAMAYIIFILKLLFGLDGFKENEISAAATKINAALNSTSVQSNSCSSRDHAKLFVWKDWVEYVEMRKVIIAQYNSAYGQQFKVNQTMSQKLDEWKLLNQQDTTTSDEKRDISNNLERVVSNLRSIMLQYERAQETATDDAFASSSLFLDEKNTNALIFQPSLMPSDSYLKYIRIHAATTKSNINIPEFMGVDHTLRTLEPFLNPNSLKEFFKKKLDKNLVVKSLSCTENKNYVGIFVSGREFASKHANEKAKQKYEADFNISKEEWLKNIADEPFAEEVTFKKVLDCYEKQYMKKLEAKASRREISQLKKELSQNLKARDGLSESEQSNLDILSQHSIEVFNENNMEPNIALNLKKPRRCMDSIPIFDENLTKNIENCVNTNSTQQNEENENDDLTLLISELDCWLLMGHITDLNSVKKKTLKKMFPRSFHWLLETCANILDVEWSIIYDQLMAIEITFGFGIHSLDDFTNFVRFKYLNRIKDINILVNWYREIW